MELDFSNQYIWGELPTQIGSLTSLTLLDLAQNILITGPIPTEFGLLTRLIEFNIYSNDFTGTVPTEIGELSNLQKLYLNYNQLTGSLPSKLGLLTKLLELHLHYNSLTGSIPSQVYQLTKMQDLSLGNNQFTGSLSTKIGDMVSLLYLKMEANYFNSSLPSQLWTLTGLKGLSLYSNEFVGSIDSTVSNMVSLQWLNMEANFLSGSLPSHLWTLTKLEELYLNDNRFTGSIHSTVGALGNLWYFYLYSNSLSGFLPSEFGLLNNLYELRLHDNQFTSSLPTTMGDLVSLEFLDLSRNSLSGSLPTQLGQVVYLSSLILSDNLLTGSPIPAGWDTMTNLYTLDLKNNKFNAPVSSSLGGLASLSSMNLSSNFALAGSLPSEVCSLKNLKSIDIKSTDISCYPSCVANAVAASSFCSACSDKPPTVTEVSFSLSGLSLSDAETRKAALTEAFASALGVPLRFVVKLVLASGSRRRLRDEPSEPGPEPEPEPEFEPELDSAGVGEMSSGSSRRLALSSVTGTFTVSIPSTFVYSYPSTSTLATSFAGKFTTLTGIPVSATVSFPTTPLPAPPATLGAGSIAGIAVGAIALCSLCLGTVYLFRRRILELMFGQVFKDYEDYESQRAASSRVHVTEDDADLSISRGSGSRGSGDGGTRTSRLSIRIGSLLGAPSALTVQGSDGKSNKKGRTSGGSAYEKTLKWETLDPFQLIGEGAFGLVYRAKWRKHVDVAVKIVKLGKLEVDVAMKTLDTEAEILTAACEGNVNEFVVRFMGTAVGKPSARWRDKIKDRKVLGEDDLMIGLVLGYEQGGNLKNFIHKRKDKAVLTMGDKLRILQEVATGLFHLHTNEPENIIHADLKPENILLSHDNKVKLTDFGLSKLALDKGSARSSVAAHGGGAAGTWVYQAPETLQDNTGNTRTSDMYSFGTICWELLTGLEPWPECKRDGPDACPEDCENANHFNSASRLRAINNGETLDFSKIPKDCPPEVLEMCRRCLSYKKWEGRGKRAPQERPAIKEAKDILDSAYAIHLDGKFDIFISYCWGARRSRQPLALTLYDELSKDYRVWMDVFNMQSDLIKSMRQGIAASSCVVVLLSPDYVVSKNCKFELEVAAEFSDKPIITCLVEEGKPWWTEWNHPITKEKASIQVGDSPNPKVADWMAHVHEKLKLEGLMVTNFGKAAGVDWNKPEDLTDEDWKLLRAGEDTMPRLRTVLKDFKVPASQSKGAIMRRKSSAALLSGGRKAMLKLERKQSKLGEFARLISGGMSAPVSAEDDDEDALVKNKERVEKLIENFEKNTE